MALGQITRLVQNPTEKRVVHLSRASCTTRFSTIGGRIRSDSLCPLPILRNVYTVIGVMNGPHPYEGKRSEGYRLNQKYCKDRYFCTAKFSGIKTRPWEIFSCRWKLRIDKGDAGGALHSGIYIFTTSIVPIMV